MSRTDPNHHWAVNIAERSIADHRPNDPEWWEHIAIQCPEDRAAALAELCSRLAKWDERHIQADAEFVRRIVEMSGNTFKMLAEARP